MQGHSKDKLTSYPNIYLSIILLFFIWGFITLLNDLLVPIFKAHFQLNYTRALLVQFVFFATYFLLALPMSTLVNYLRYKKSIIAGLFIIAIGALSFIPAHHYESYYLFLLALFILASGVVTLQVSANPLITLLGAQKTASARLTLAQAINSAGTVLGPLIVAGIISNTTLVPIYIVMAIVAILTAWFISTRNFNISCITKPVNQSNHPKNESNTSDLKLWQSTGFMFSILGIFFYVGAEVASGSLIISFAQLPNILSLSIKRASYYLSIFWGLAMIGRFLGSYLLTHFKDSFLLLIAACINIGLVLMLTLNHGAIAFASILSLGLFNSIMFPVIFAMGIGHFSNASQKNRAAGYLIMAIVGGAVIPILQGGLADHFGLQHSFFLLLLCYGFIALFGFAHMRLTKK